MERALCFCHSIDLIYLTLEIPIAHPLPPTYLLGARFSKMSPRPFPEGFQMPSEAKGSGVIDWPLALALEMDTMVLPALLDVHLPL